MRVFHDVNDDNTDNESRIIGMTEAHDLFVRAQRLNELESYVKYLKGYYDFKDEVALQMEEEGQSARVTAVNVNLVPLVRSSENDESFMDIMDHCSKEMHYFRTSERDILDVINPGCKI